MEDRQILLDGMILDWRPSVKYLGIVIDAGLCWSPHVAMVETKAARIIGFLRYLRAGKDIGNISFDQAIFLYRTLVLSIVRYGLAIWGHATALTRLDRLQNKFLRDLFGSFPRTDLGILRTITGLPELNWWTRQEGIKLFARAERLYATCPDHNLSQAFYRWQTSSGAWTSPKAPSRSSSAGWSQGMNRRRRRSLQKRSFRSPLQWGFEETEELRALDSSLSTSLGLVAGKWASDDLCEQSLEWKIERRRQGFFAIDKGPLCPFLNPRAVPVERVCASLNDRHILYWTDGSAQPNPGYGGAGLFLQPDLETATGHSWPVGSLVDNVDCELAALGQACKMAVQQQAGLSFPCRHVVLTDCLWAVNALYGIYRGGQKCHQVCTLGKQWNAAIMDGVSLELYWVKAHVGIPGNERADALAKIGMKIARDASPSSPSRSGTNSRRPGFQSGYSGLWQVFEDLWWERWRRALWDRYQARSRDSSLAIDVFQFWEIEALDLRRAGAVILPQLSRSELRWWIWSVTGKGPFAGTLLADGISSPAVSDGLCACGEQHTLLHLVADCIVSATARQQWLANVQLLPLDEPWPSLWGKTVGRILVGTGDPNEVDLVKMTLVFVREAVSCTSER